MASPNSSDIVQKSKNLRAELKKWEKEFSAANNGKKASREDIRQNPQVAAKYKEYSRIKVEQSRIVSNPLWTNQSTSPLTNKIGKNKSGRINLPPEIYLTPSRKRTHSGEFASHNTPSVIRNLFTPSKKSLGPTPQKEGHVLGLFDILRDDENNFPAKVRDAAALDSPHTYEHTTPSKPSANLNHTRDGIAVTPTLNSKQSKLNMLSTPSKKASGPGLQPRTPSSVSKLNYSTPSFLRRYNEVPQSHIKAEDGFPLVLSPKASGIVRKKPSMRGLSTILAELRESLDEDLDAELMALREMEAEELGVDKSAPLDARSKYSLTAAKKSLVENDDLQGSLASFDTGFLQRSQISPKNPDTLFKKRGQKRTTRRVNLKPTRSKPIMGAIDTLNNASLKSTNLSLLQTHDNTIAANSEVDDKARNFDSDSQSEYTASEGETRYRRPKQDRRLTKTTAGMTKDYKEGTGSIGVKSIKVGALAHQNFKRLKIRNSGAKGSLAQKNSRFKFSRKKK